MSTALSTIRDNIRAELARTAGSFEKPTAQRITTTNKKFTLPNGVATNKPINLVILDYRNARTLYAAAYNPNNPQPPQCYAFGKVIDDLVPSDSVPNPVHTDCTTCPKNQWGSDPTGGKGKACKNSVRLAVVPADLGGEKSVAETDVYALDVTPTGLRNWNGLVSRLEMAGKHVMEVVTEVAFNPDAAYPTLMFAEQDAHEQDERVWMLFEKAQPLLVNHPNEN